MSRLILGRPGVHRPKLTPVDTTRRQLLASGAVAAALVAAPSASHAASGTASVNRDATRRKSGMSSVTMRDGTEIFYKDWGEGQPIVFHHGWPLSSDDWDAQMLYFLDKGYRVIAHDRRGHGR